MIRLDYPRLILSVIICQLAGVFGSFFTISAIPAWYATLNKPWFTPPNWLFGPVWISLYTLMGISLYLIWAKGFREKKGRIALGVFVIQLGLNAAWSLLFFGLQSPLLGLAGIIPLWVFIALNIWAFWRIDKRAGYLLVPYVAWVTIATALNYYVWILNA
jgi:tryptophan-rich sensory protein